MKKVVKQELFNNYSTLDYLDDCIVCKLPNYDLRITKNMRQRLVTAYSEIIECLKELGYNDAVSLENFIGTPERAANALCEIILPMAYIKEAINSELARSFPANGKSQMVVAHGITTFGMCPHHLLPVMYKIWIGYITRERYLGMSKITRIARLVSARPALHEDVANDLADIFGPVDERVQDAFGCIDGEGCGIYVSGLHNCMVCRGVKDSSPRTTQVLRGALLTHDSARNEFLTSIQIELSQR